MKLYIYAAAGRMTDHKFSDDVAITFARNKKEAEKLFSGLYRGCVAGDVVGYSKRHLKKNVVIVTDY